MKSWIFLLFCLSFSFFSTSLAQIPKCGTDMRHSWLMDKDSKYASDRSEIEKSIALFNSEEKSANEIIIPVVFHIIYRVPIQNISDAQIQSQLDVLNRDFNKLNWDTSKVPQVWQDRIADVNFRFVLANRDPNGNPTSGVTRTETDIVDIADINGSLYYQSSKGGQDIWDRDNYLNIWVCEISGGVYGFASFPGSPAESDGVVIDFGSFGTMGTAKSPTDKGRTATHEIGHWFDLLHLWGFSLCGDDMVADTPEQLEGNFGCETYPHNTSCNITADGEMFMNFMDYSDDDCLNFFTDGQKDRMIATLNASRSSLLSSPGYNQIQEFNSTRARVFPNPTSGVIQLEFEENVYLDQIEIYDLTGQLIDNQIIGNWTYLIDMNLTDEKAGIYFIKLYTDQGVLTEKIIVWRP